MCSESIEIKRAPLLRVLGGYMHNGGNHLSSVLFCLVLVWNNGNCCCSLVAVYIII